MQPFIGSVEIRRGALTRRGLARDHVALYRDVYVRRDIELTARIRAQAAWLSSGATLAGVSAAAVLGTKWLNPNMPAEIIRADRHAQAGIVVHTWQLGERETCRAGGAECTTPARTAFDLGRRYAAQVAVPVLDALMNATGVTREEVAVVIDAHPGFRGVANVRAVLDLVDGGAESPQESRLRLLLVEAGLPRPETQIVFRDLRIRVDLGWRRWKVAVEYDGVQHWSDARQRSWDIDRIALLEDAGWSVVRVSAEMMARPDVIAARVRAKLRAAGCPI
ncbi:endonuclease domain-containing protein [Mycolicibacterium fluoranthenivorans]|uniref:Very-short-patch-repair endonuclease n=1 Tax=Mycolicibacterium fluoranthenivorans TaxID=258505 RepID=A0A7X5ZB96_9MYCO|nr:DUF559 domain-containing protein [Mycolicibacterium fluoranthenivorans]MCV7356702.1 DUF559 domain-containing protein [Mycolicibacterium fluoranthenivorans]NIH94094.1 very-short-patch-repair endonuclease [Mycolicibacterium fluoranthenivorans]